MLFFFDLQDQVELTRIEEGTTQLKKIALGMNDVRKQCRLTSHALLLTAFPATVAHSIFDMLLC